MNSAKLCVSDLHLHTNLSVCAPSTTTLNSYLPFCAEEGIQKIGISNHHYISKGIGHSLKIREEIDSIKNDLPIKILVGCEVELFYGREPLMNKEEASNFDYILLAPSHIFNQIHNYENFDLSTSDKIRQLLLDNFKENAAVNFILVLTRIAPNLLLINTACWNVQLNVPA